MVQHLLNYALPQAEYLVPSQLRAYAGRQEKLASELAQNRARSAGSGDIDAKVPQESTSSEARW